MNSNNNKHYIVTLLLAGLLCLMWFSARWGLANIYAYQALKHIEQWQAKKPELVEETTEAMVWIKKARHLDSNNPELISYQAQIFEWQALLNEDEIKTSSYLESAAKLYRDALSIRPTWPFDWVALADIKSQLNQFDSEFSKALERSSTLGPWEFTIQKRLINIGFKHWDKLTSADRDNFLQTIRPFFTVGMFLNHSLISAKLYDQP